MIVAKQKPFEEIKTMIESYRRVLVLGCGTCTAICFAGGEKEVGVLASSLRIAEKLSGNQKEIKEYTIERQCEWEFIDEIKEYIKDVDAILSLGCGVGVQAVGERYPDIPVLPGLNTLFFGMPVEDRVWIERCAGCGNCMLDKTAGICPIARCAKGLLNGPCGGSEGGKCEISSDIPCAWQLIYDRLSARGQLNKLEEIEPPRDWSSSHAGGLRKVTLDD
jgi:ferredoxin